MFILTFLFLWCEESTLEICSSILDTPCINTCQQTRPQSACSCLNVNSSRNSHNKTNKCINIQIIFFYTQFIITTTCFELYLHHLQGVAEHQQSLPFLCCSMYCLCVNVYCTTATGWLPNCS